MTVRELVLARHGQPEGNVAAEAAHRDELPEIDVPAQDPDVVLSETGRRQATALGRWIAELPEDERPGVVWSSPYRRARETAEIQRSTTDGLRNAAVCRIARDENSPTGWRLTAYNEDSHLHDHGVDVTDQPGTGGEIEGSRWGHEGSGCRPEPSRAAAASGWPHSASRQRRLLAVSSGEPASASRSGR